MPRPGARGPRVARGTSAMTDGRRGPAIAAVLAVVALALVAVGVFALPRQAASGTVSPRPSGSLVALGSQSGSAVPSASPPPTPGSPSPSLVVAPLDGLQTTAANASRHPVAVMVDDLSPARPQSGFSAASVVWQAPAEGGIPRYMMVFQERLPKSIGPIRSSRLYHIAWAAEWRAVYVHAGGSPQALETLAAKGHGQYVYNADGFRYEGRELYRITSRLPPHNLYSDAANLGKLIDAVRAPSGPAQPVWSFAADAPVEDRPVGGTVDVRYPYNHIHYAYDRLSNSYRRSVTAEGPQKDAATGQRVAPKNVVVIVMHFGPLNDGHPQKHRLEANFVGSGRAWVFTNGRAVRATWRKKSFTGPTLLYDAAGRKIALTAGQTFVQVIQSATELGYRVGKPAPRPPAGARGVA